MESKPAVFAIRAISIERTMRTVIEETTSPRASFSLTLLRTISRGDGDMAFLSGGKCPPIACSRARGNPWSDRTEGAMRYDIAIHGGTVFEGRGEMTCATAKAFELADRGALPGPARRRS